MAEQSISYGIGLSDQQLNTMLNSDVPEIRQQAENYLATAQSQQAEKPNILQRIGNFFNIGSAGAAEPNILDRKSVITGDFPQNQFPFRSMAEMAAENDLALNNMYTTPNIPFDANTFDDVTTSGKLPIVMSPKVNYLSSQNFPKIEFGGTVLEDDNTGITQSTAAREFEEPFQIINGQKVYISDILGTRQAEEKANVFQEPKGILTQAKDFITQQLPKTLKGGLDTLINFIPGMRFVRAIDKFDTLPYMDRKFIESRMGGDVPGISVDPRTGLLTDAAGLNVRSLRGNYAEAVDDEYERYSKAIERAKEKYGVGFDGTSFTGANADIANKMNDRNINMFNFFKNQKAAKDQQIADLRAKVKKQVEAGVTADKGQAMHGGGDGGGFDKAKYEAGKASAIAQEQSMRDYARGKFN